MHRRNAVLATLVVIVVAAAAATLLWSRSRDVRRIVRPEGEFVLVKGKYAIVILSPEMMKRTFGPDWDHLSLFYGSNRGVTEDGERAALAPSPLRPLAKGTPVLIFSGDEWSDLIAPVYALETRQQATFAIDTTKPSVIVIGATRSRAGEPHLTPEGRLFFH